MSKLLLVCAAFFISHLVTTPVLAANRDLAPDNSQESTTTKTLRIGFGSCWAAHDDTVWKVIEDQKLHYFVPLGDNVYLPSNVTPDKSLYEETYDKLFSGLHFQHLRHSVTLLPIWDDHDYGRNNSDSTYVGRAFAEGNFRKYWNISKRPEGFDRGIHRIYQTDLVKFILTDNRSFRESPARVQSTAHFGKEQVAWIKREIETSKTPIILASGGQFFAEGKSFENLKQHPDEYRELRQAIATAPQPIIIISGDRHFAEITDLDLNGKHVFEVTSSPLAGHIESGAKIRPQKGRIAVYRGSPNFGVLTLTSEPRGLSVLVEIKRNDGSVALNHFGVLH
ncbi:MAG: alkaline phosphatase family protein [Bdellovibrionales bacterium]|nr:alkaline phosphatase family protein [Bdellovibrionales bacterium]